jgi:PAS domain S-box-containing protein
MLADTASKKTILLVEDEALIAFAEKKELQRKGYNVHHVLTGEQAVHAVLAEAIPFDMILMDIDLGPGMDGTQVAEEILAHRNIPVVFLSSHTEPEVVEKTEKITSYGYVVKNSGMIVLDASIKMAFRLFDSHVALQVNRELLARSQEMGHLGSWTLDLCTNHLTWSDEVYRIFGVDPDVFGASYEAFLDCVHPDDREMATEAYGGSLRNNSDGYDIEHRIIRQDTGDIRYVHERCIHERDAAGRVVRSVGMVQDITETKSAVNALRESKETYQALIQAMPDIVMRFDRDGRHLFVSENVYGQVQIRAEQFIGKTHRELGFPEDLSKFWEESIRRVFDSGNPYETEFSIPGPEGELHLNWRLVPERYQDEAVHSVLSITRDVTGHRRAEQDQRTLFREMLNGFAVHDIICDESGQPVDYRFLEANPAFEHMTGLKADQIVGKTVLDVLPGTEPHWIETYGSVALTGKPVHFESFSGEIDKYFEVTAFSPSPHRFACIFTDITERKNAEQELMKSEIRHRSVLETAMDGFWLTDLEGNLLEVNDTYCRMSGYAAHELTAMNVSHIEVMETPEDTAKHIQKVMTEGADRFETQHRRKDGTIYDVETGVQFIPLEGGRLVVFLRDISDRKKSEQALRDQLIEKEIILKEVHHRIKNNIASIGSLLTLQAGSTSNAEARTAIENAVHRVESVRQVYEKLLYSESYKELSIKDYIESLTESIIATFPGREHLRLDLDIDDFCISVRNAFPLGAIINELLTNCIKYAFKGKTSGRIKLSLCRANGQAVLRITDNGIGLSEDFDPETSGGFGIMLVRLLAQQLDGTFSLESNRGTTSVVVFPVE